MEIYESDIKGLLLSIAPLIVTWIASKINKCMSDRKTIIKTSDISENYLNFSMFFLIIMVFNALVAISISSLFTASLYKYKVIGGVSTKYFFNIYDLLIIMLNMLEYIIAIRIFHIKKIRESLSKKKVLILNLLLVSFPLLSSLFSVFLNYDAINSSKITSIISVMILLIALISFFYYLMPKRYFRYSSVKVIFADGRLKCSKFKDFNKEEDMISITYRSNNRIKKIVYYNISEIKSIEYVADTKISEDYEKYLKRKLLV